MRTILSRNEAFTLLFKKYRHLTHTMMMSATVGLIAISLIGCSGSGGGGGGGNSNAANPDAIKKISASMVALGNAKDSKSVSVSTSSSMKLNLNTFSQRIIANTISNNSTNGNSQQKQLEQSLDYKVKSALNESDCEFILPEEKDPNKQPANGNGNSNVPVTNKLTNSIIEIKGPKCPMTARMEIKVQDATGETALVTAQFVVHDEQLKKELDISEGSYSGQIKMKAPTNNDPNSKKINIEMYAKIAMNGNSLTYGQFSSEMETSASININLEEMNKRSNSTKPMPLSADGSDNNDLSKLFGSLFQGFVAEHQLYQVGGGTTDLSSKITYEGNGNVTQDCFINGKKVTPEEYANARSEIVDPMNPGGGNSGGSGHNKVPPKPEPINYNSSCTLSVFDQNKTTQSELDLFVSKKQSIAALPEFQVSSCNKNISFNSTTIFGNEVNYGISFYQDVINGYIITKSDNHSYNINLQPAYLSRKRGYVNTMIDGNYIVFICDSVPKCD